MKTHETNSDLPSPTCPQFPLNDSSFFKRGGIVYCHWRFSSEEKYWKGKLQRFRRWVHPTLTRFTGLHLAQMKRSPGTGQTRCWFMWERMRTRCADGEKTRTRTIWRKRRRRHQRAKQGKMCLNYLAQMSSALRYQNTFEEKQRSNFFPRLFAYKFFDICTYIQSHFVILLLNSWWNRLWSEFRPYLHPGASCNGITHQQLHTSQVTWLECFWAYQEQ